MADHFNPSLSGVTRTKTKHRQPRFSGITGTHLTHFRHRNTSHQQAPYYQTFGPSTKHGQGALSLAISGYITQLWSLSQSKRRS